MEDYYMIDCLDRDSKLNHIGLHFRQKVVSRR
jgi:hypothetical protein